LHGNDLFFLVVWCILIMASLLRRGRLSIVLGVAHPDIFDIWVRLLPVIPSVIPEPPLVPSVADGVVHPDICPCSGKL
jgi:hypothetical protein